MPLEALRVDQRGVFLFQAATKQRLLTLLLQPFFLPFVFEQGLVISY